MTVVQTGLALAAAWLALAGLHALLQWWAGEAYERWLLRHNVSVSWVGVSWQGDPPALLEGAARMFPRLWGPWFASGAALALVGMVAGAVALVAHLVWIYGLDASRRAVTSPVLVPVVPGVNMPLSDGLYYLLAMLLATVVHEAGHALAALTHRCAVDGMGLAVMLMLPAAFTHVRSSDLELSSRVTRLRVLGAGAWHNVVLCLAALALVALLPLILAPLYASGRGMSVVRSSVLPPGAVVTSLNGCTVGSEADWNRCYGAMMGDAHQAFCVARTQVLAATDHECCEMGYRGSLQCFHHRSRMHCLSATSVIADGARRCNITAACAPDAVCMDASLAPDDRLIWMTLLDGSTRVYVGSPVWFWHAVTMSPLTPRVAGAWLLGLDLKLVRLLQYVVSLSGALAVLNLLPVHFLDGSHILDVLWEGRDPDVLHWAKTGATALLIVNVLASFFIGRAVGS